ncbi:hypothetical protein PIB30_031938 [Stylosanthes scabra]|uniref:Uncharacterized protein n=1 Tax=Stylosanthes scabra TaxID=79078 RepID=A0ABU6QBR9_9FABA|nr:hypothetical protein [Stylosanthes scabra]
MLTRRRYWRRRIQRGGGNTGGASAAEHVDGVGAIKVKAHEQKAPPAWQAIAA